MCNIVALAAFGLALLSLLRGSALRVRFDRFAEEIRRREAPPSGRDPPRQPASPPVAAAISPSSERPPVPSRPTPVASRWEQTLAEHWLVWLGGLTLALGGAFLVDLSIGYGLLTPAVRVGLGLLLGIALAAGAEHFGRREPDLDDRRAASFYRTLTIPAAIMGCRTSTRAITLPDQRFTLCPSRATASSPAGKSD